MKARVNGIESGKDYKDKQRRITLKFEGASVCFDKITIAESKLGWAAGAAQLDDELEITIGRINMPHGVELEPVPAAGPGFVPNPVGELVQKAKSGFCEKCGGSNDYSTVNSGRGLCYCAPRAPQPAASTPISDEGIPF